MVTELEYQFFLFGGPVIMSLTFIGVAIVVYRKCKKSIFTYSELTDSAMTKKAEANEGI